ncbi:MAG: UDP-N-acetylmuramoyl-L-alanine--D-glutamate ligase [Bacteroidales bacterium]|nr:UDP-N-acetylmuramoyl-L-alanine--D-glutamate ligase [Bacteroidales bacterium]
MINKLKSELWENKSILILGFGREGKSALKFLESQFPDAVFAIADKIESIELQKDSNYKLHLGKDYLDAIKLYDIVIKSPGIKLPDLSENEKNKIIAPTDIFLCLFRDQTIGITGTKGKSTTSSLIYFLLKALGKKSILLGNIGLPALDYADQIDENTIVVYELSAHQLEFVHYSPHTSLLLNVFPEHLDYFENFEKYRLAKYNIFKFQKRGDVALCAQSGLECGYCSDPKPIDMELNSLIQSPYNLSELEKNTQLKGTHNLNNIVAALRVIKSVGLNVNDAISHLSQFEPLPHRLEFVGEFDGVRFYNDSIATIPEATVQALETLSDVDIIILGGFDRGLDYSVLTNYLVDSKVKQIFFLGKAGERMFNTLKAKTNKKLHLSQNLDEVFSQLRSLTELKACLLSPAASSYDQFKNFEHRGDYFKLLAQRFHKE